PPARRSRHATYRPRSCRYGTGFWRKSLREKTPPPARMAQDPPWSPSGRPRRSDMGVSADAVTWGYRFFLGREPESSEVVAAHLGAKDEIQLAQVLMSSP